MAPWRRICMLRRCCEVARRRGEGAKGGGGEKVLPGCRQAGSERDLSTASRWSNLGDANDKTQAPATKHLNSLFAAALCSKARACGGAKMDSIGVGTRGGERARMRALAVLDALDKNCIKGKREREGEGLLGGRLSGGAGHTAAGETAASMARRPSTPTLLCTWPQSDICNYARSTTRRPAHTTRQRCRPGGLAVNDADIKPRPEWTWRGQC